MNRFIRKVSAMMLLALIPIAMHAQKVVKVESPDKKITVDLATEKGKFGWTVNRNGAKVYSMEDVRMIINGKTYAGNAAVKNVKQKSVSETIKPVVPLKFSTIENNYTEATINFGSYSVEMRVMNNAVAYRFVTNISGEVTVENDLFTMIPADGYTTHFQHCGSFNTSYEGHYQHKSVNDWVRDNRLATVPMLLSGDNDTQLLIGESDVDDYPRMFFKGNRKGISTAFPKSPISWEPWGDRGWTITEEGHYIAKTQGKRTFP